MKVFIKAKLKKLYDQTNIDKYRGAAISTKYYIKANFDLLRLGI